MGTKSRIAALLGATALVTCAPMAFAQQADVDIAGETVTVSDNAGDRTISNISDNDDDITATITGTEVSVTDPTDFSEASASVDGNSAAATALGDDSDNSIVFAPGATGDGDAQIGNLSISDGAITATITDSTFEVDLGDATLDADGSISVDDTAVTATGAGTQASNAITGDLSDIESTGNSADVTVDAAGETVTTAGNSIAIGNGQTNDDDVVTSVTDTTIGVSGVTDVDADSDGITVNDSAVAADTNGNIGFNTIDVSNETDDSGFVIGSLQVNEGDNTATVTDTEVSVTIDDNGIDADIDVNGTSVTASTRNNRVTNSLNVLNSGADNRLEIESAQVNDGDATTLIDTVDIEIDGGDSDLSGADLSIANSVVSGIGRGNSSTSTISLNNGSVDPTARIESLQQNGGAVSTTVQDVTITASVAGAVDGGSRVNVSNNAISATSVGNQTTNRISVGD